MNFLKEKKRKNLIIFISMVLIYFLSSFILGFNLLFFLDIGKGFGIVSKQYFTPVFSGLSSFTSLRFAVVDTILLSLTSTMIGAGFAFLIVALSFNTHKYNIARYIGSVTSSICRNIPPYIWGLLLIFFLWYGSFIAIIALSIATYGFLYKVFAEVMLTKASGSVEALKSTGANNAQIIFKAVIPDTSPQLISWILYAFELNIRGATIVALVTRFGLGGLLQDAIELDFRTNPDKYKIQMAIILTISLLVILINILVVRIRRRLLSWN